MNIALPPPKSYLGTISFLLFLVLIPSQAHAQLTLISQPPVEAVLLPANTPPVAESLSISAIINAIINALAIPNLIEARTGGEESAAIGSLRTITTAQPLLREPDRGGEAGVLLLEDTSATMGLRGIDFDGDTLTFSIVSGPSHGTLVDAGNETECSLLSFTPPVKRCLKLFSYTPDPNFNGFDILTFKVNDGLVDSALTNVTIEILPVNDPPAVMFNPINTQILERENDPARLVIAEVRVEDPDLDPNLNQHPDALVQNQLDPRLGKPKEQLSLAVKVFKDRIETNETNVLVETRDPREPSEGSKPGERTFKPSDPFIFICDATNAQKAGLPAAFCKINLRLETPAFGTAGEYSLHVTATDIMGEQSDAIIPFTIAPSALARVKVHKHTVSVGSGLKPERELVEEAAVTAFMFDPHECSSLDKVKKGECIPKRTEFTNKEGVAELPLGVRSHLPSDPVSISLLFTGYFFRVVLPDESAIKYLGPEDFFEGLVKELNVEFVDVSTPPRIPRYRPDGKPI